MNREDHLAWCKRRALQYVDRGQVIEGLTSMLSDMGKHPETQSPALTTMTMGLIMIGSLDSPEAARRHIEGFH